MFFPVFFDNIIALVRNNDSLEKDNITAIYLSDGRVNYSAFTPKTLRRRYYTLLNNERSKLI